MDSIRRRGREHPRSPSSPPQRQPAEQINPSPAVQNNGDDAIGVSMGTQTSFSVETQTSPKQIAINCNQTQPNLSRSQMESLVVLL